MKPNPFRYHAPASVEEALGLLSELDNAKVLAGGQSLMAMLNLRYAMPDDLIDVNGLSDLAGVEASPDRISIGAMTRQRVLERSGDLARYAPVFREALLQVGHIQTRNRGTIGGSLCHLDPAAELPSVCMLHDAEVTVRSAAGERTIAMVDFPAFYMTPSIQHDEIVTRISFRPWSGTGSGGGPGAGPGNVRHAFIEYARRHGDFAIVAAGCLLSVSPAGDIDRAAIVLGGVGAAPLRLAAAERSLVGQKPTADAIASAAELATDIDAMEDSAYSADYRRHLARVLTRRALTKAMERAA